MSEKKEKDTKFFDKLKRPFRSHSRTNSLDNKGMSNKGSSSANATIDNAYAKGEAVGVKAAKEERAGVSGRSSSGRESVRDSGRVASTSTTSGDVIQSTSVGNVVTSPPKPNTTPIDKSAGDYANYKPPTHDTVVREEGKALKSNSNPLYSNDAEKAQGTGYFYDPKDTQGGTYKNRHANDYEEKTQAEYRDYNSLKTQPTELEKDELKSRNEQKKKDKIYVANESGFDENLKYRSEFSKTAQDSNDSSTTNKSAYNRGGVSQILAQNKQSDNASTTAVHGDNSSTTALNSDTSRNQSDYLDANENPEHAQGCIASAAAAVGSLAASVGLTNPDTGKPYENDVTVHDGTTYRDYAPGQSTRETNKSATSSSGYAGLPGVSSHGTSSNSDSHYGSSTTSRSTGQDNTSSGVSRSAGVGALSGLASGSSHQSTSQSQPSIKADNYKSSNLSNDPDIARLDAEIQRTQAEIDRLKSEPDTQNFNSQAGYSTHRSVDPNVVGVSHHQRQKSESYDPAISSVTAGTAFDRSGNSPSGSNTYHDASAYHDANSHYEPAIRPVTEGTVFDSHSHQDSRQQQQSREVAREHQEREHSRQQEQEKIRHQERENAKEQEHKAKQINQDSYDAGVLKGAYYSGVLAASYDNGVLRGAYDAGRQLGQYDSERKAAEEKRIAAQEKADKERKVLENRRADQERQASEDKLKQKAAANHTPIVGTKESVAKDTGITHQNTRSISTNDTPKRDVGIVAAAAATAASGSSKSSSDAPPLNSTTQKSTSESKDSFKPNTTSSSGPYKVDSLIATAEKHYDDVAEAPAHKTLRKEGAIVDTDDGDEPEGEVQAIPGLVTTTATNARDLQSSTTKTPTATSSSAGVLNVGSKSHHSTPTVADSSVNKSVSTVSKDSKDDKDDKHSKSSETATDSKLTNAAYNQGATTGAYEAGNVQAAKDVSQEQNYNRNAAVVGPSVGAYGANSTAHKTAEISDADKKTINAAYIQGGEKAAYEQGQLTGAYQAGNVEASRDISKEHNRALDAAVAGAASAGYDQGLQAGARDIQIEQKREQERYEQQQRAEQQQRYEQQQRAEQQRLEQQRLEQQRAEQQRIEEQQHAKAVAASKQAALDQLLTEAYEAGTIQGAKEVSSKQSQPRTAAVAGATSAFNQKSVNEAYEAGTVRGAQDVSQTSTHTKSAATGANTAYNQKNIADAYGAGAVQGSRDASREHSNYNSALAGTTGVAAGASIANYSGSKSASGIQNKKLDVEGPYDNRSEVKDSISKDTEEESVSDVIVSVQGTRNNDEATKIAKTAVEQLKRERPEVLQTAKELRINYQTGIITDEFGQNVSQVKGYGGPVESRVENLAKNHDYDAGKSVIGHSESKNTSNHSTSGVASSGNNFGHSSANPNFSVGPTSTSKSGFVEEFGRDRKPNNTTSLNTDSNTSSGYNHASENVGSRSSGLAGSSGNTPISNHGLGDTHSAHESKSHNLSSQDYGFSDSRKLSDPKLAGVFAGGENATHFSKQSSVPSTSTTSTGSVLGQGTGLSHGSHDLNTVEEISQTVKNDGYRIPGAFD